MTGMLELRFIDGSGNPSIVAPAAMGLEFTATVNDKGTVKYDYPAAGVGFTTATTPLNEGCVFLDGVELRNSRFLVKQKADPGEDDDGRIVEVNAPTLIGRLDRALVYPPNGVGTQPTAQSFTNKSAGHIVNLLVTQAKARGTLSWLDITTFGTSTDSNAAAWANTVTLDFEQGTTILAVLQKLVELGVVDYEMRGRSLRLYNPGTMGTDRSTGANPVTLSAGRDLDDGPRNTDADPVSVMLVIGDDGAATEQVNSTSVATFGRIEAPLSMSGVSDSGTLIAAGQIALLGTNHAKYEVSHGLRCTSTAVIPTAKNPYVHYWLADKVLVDNGADAVTPYTVKQIVLKNAKEGLSGTIRLNDLIEDRDVATDLALSRLTGGSVNDSPAISGTDKLAPAAPAAPTLGSSAYVAADGQIQSQVTVSWAAVTTNSDGTACTDLAGYEVQTATVSGNWIPAGTVTTPVAYVSPYPPGTLVYVRVRAFDGSGNKSAWSGTSSITTSTDAVAPPTPSTPILTTPFLESVRIQWDGLGSAGEAMPKDFARLEVHMSTTSGFTPSSSTQVDEFDTIGGITTIQGPPGVAQFVKLIAVDRSGNKSAASAQASATPTKAVTSEIGLLQVTDALIATLTVTKLTAGTLGADMVVGARIKTADTGARVELNSSGLRAYNASNALTVSINASDGSASFTGSITGSTITGSTFETSPLSSAKVKISQNQMEFFTGASGETSGKIIVTEAGRAATGNPSENVPHLVFNTPNYGGGAPYIEMYGTSNGTHAYASSISIVLFGGTGTASVNQAVFEVLGADLVQFGTSLVDIGYNLSASARYLRFYSTFSSGADAYLRIDPDGDGNASNATMTVVCGELVLEPQPTGVGTDTIRLNASILYSQLTVTSGTAQTPLHLNLGTDVVFGFTSSGRWKDLMEEMTEPKWELLQVSPWRYKGTAAGDTNFGTEPAREVWGLVAEDLDEVGLHELVVYDEEGLPFGIDSDHIAHLMLPMIRDLKARVEALESV